MKELKMGNTNVIKSILKTCTLFPYIVPYNRHPDDVQGISETCLCYEYINK